MAKYKALPNYELIRPGINVQFNSMGIYETNNEKEITILDGAKPFIQRVDKPEPKPEPKPKAPAKKQPSEK